MADVWLVQAQVQGGQVQGGQVAALGAHRWGGGPVAAAGAQYTGYGEHVQDLEDSEQVQGH